MTITNEPQELHNGIRISVLQTQEDLIPFRADWDRLASEDKRDGLFRGFAWNVLWLEHIAPRATPHVLKLTTDGGEVVGIVPLCKTQYKDRFLRMPSLGFMGREVVCGDFLDVLTAPGYEEPVLIRVIEYLEDALVRHSLIVLGECVRGSQTARRLDAWVRTKKLHARWQEERASPYIELPSSFEEYRSTLSRNTKSNLKRRERQLLEEQGYTVQRLHGAEKVLPMLPHFFRLHDARWRSVGKEGAFAQPGFCEFLRAFIGEGHPQMKTELYLMLAGETPVAAILFFRWSEAILYYQSGWDPASPAARLSPGFVLHGKAIADAITDGYRYFEFLRGDEPYKMKFTATARRTATLLVASRGVRPCAYLFARGVGDRVRGLLRGGSDETKRR